MKIYLLMDHTALLVNDHKDTVRIEPACSGILEIEGTSYKIENGGVAPYRKDLIGHVHVIFTTQSGQRYIGIRPHMDAGVAVSHIDYAAAYVPLRLKLDELERQVDELAKAYHVLAAQSKHDALGFLTHNTKKSEV